MGEMVRWLMLRNGAVEDNVALFGGLLCLDMLDFFHIVTIWLLQRGF